ncbi:MAG: sigma-70 family RNA polymerase sigma factor [Spirochaetes bacterium]|nr:sigma-70 family RNA polymerase sigma factor [Spirochaetota bacterium]
MDEQKFAEIVHRTKATVLAAIERHLPPEFFHAIDDIVQETYLRAYKWLLKHRCVESEQIQRWLYTIAKNETLRMIKRLRRNEYILESIPMNAQPNDRKDETKIQPHHIEKLPLKYRSVMALAFEGYSEFEISQKLAIPLGTVKSRKFRGKELLFKILTKEES